MTEEVLQHIWQYQIFEDDSIHSLKTVDGKSLKILNVGFKNFNQGPDFQEAKILLDEIEWNGNIEIHIKSSLWNVHNHQNDKNYDNVILHVVLEDDKPVFRSNGEQIPCVEISEIIKKDFIQKYNDFINSETIIPCERYIENVRSITKKSMLERVLIERLERKSNLFNEWLDENNGDWEQTTFEVIAYCFGLKINAIQFRDIAHKISYKTIQKHQDNKFQIESILFGLAGFLDENSDDEYQQKLKKEFTFLSHKYNFNNLLQKENWKFHRLRPASFPTLRIAQFASFLQANEFVFSKILETKKSKNLIALFKISLSPYWANHYDFGKESKLLNINIGSTKIDNIIINGVVPLLFLYYKKTGDEELLNRCFYFLESIKPEYNSKLGKLNNIFENKSSYDSQSILELFDYYCILKNCINCSVYKAIV